MKSGANIAEKDCVSFVITPTMAWGVQNLFLNPHRMATAVFITRRHWKALKF